MGYVLMSQYNKVPFYVKPEPLRSQSSRVHSTKSHTAKGVNHYVSWLEPTLFFEMVVYPLDQAASVFCRMRERLVNDEALPAFAVAVLPLVGDGMGYRMP